VTTSNTVTRKNGFWGSIFVRCSFHHHYDIGLPDPQPEVGVWLCSPDEAQDVTYRNVIACAHPLVIGIGLDGGRNAGTGQTRLSLQFRERSGRNQLLGEIDLRLSDCIPAGSAQLHLFTVLNCRNYCLPRAQRWEYDLRCIFERWSSRIRRKIPEICQTPLETRCLSTLYTCPRPVVLVSVTDGSLYNIFPMDLIGPVSSKGFCLALHNTSAPLPLLEHSRRIALSNVPIEQKTLAYNLGKNHSRPPFSKDLIPFDTVTSALFGLPVPRFAMRVREMQIVAIRPMGSHRLFVCEILEDRAYSSGLHLFVIHGLYQAWRQQRTPKDIFALVT
jgi:flavin reductase (DIM6/NTAB) family NADH-FMN oxidoreductase RutF